MAKMTVCLLALLFLHLGVFLAVADGEAFMDCMSSNRSSSTTKNLGLLLQKGTQAYHTAYQQRQQNTRWLNNSTYPGPLFIVIPSSETDVQAAVICSRHNSLQVRVRSGGHDYEGLSWLSEEQNYILIDLFNLNEIRLNVSLETVWVQTGATLGKLYYSIAQNSHVHAFPGGTCPTVGTGGLISGGGFGMLTRSHGLAADNVIDAKIVNANGDILDRKAMGEDLFWAIRGGGGASFGVLVAWRLKLVRVPSNITVFSVHRNRNMGATQLIKKWQEITPKMDDRLVMRVLLTPKANGDSSGEAAFNTQFLGTASELLTIMRKEFPELGVTEQDCHELTWVRSVLFFYSLNHTGPLEGLLELTDPFRTSYKGKSDFVTSPIPNSGIEGVWRRLMKEKDARVSLDPFGGFMNSHSSSDLPFPYRKGILFNIQYIVKWNSSSTTPEEKAVAVNLDWINELYQYMSPYVTSNPRSAYLNYKDCDLGVNDADFSYSTARVWGEQYFGSNFKRLAQVKRMADPTNFFRNNQSIPPYPHRNSHAFTILYLVTAVFIFIASTVYIVYRHRALYT